MIAWTVTVVDYGESGPPYEESTFGVFDTRAAADRWVSDRWQSEPEPLDIRVEALNLVTEADLDPDEHHYVGDGTMSCRKCSAPMNAHASAYAGPGETKP